MSTIHFVEGYFGMTQFYACVLSHLLMQTQPIAIFRVKGQKAKQNSPLQNLYPNTKVITTTYTTREFDQIWDVAKSGTPVVVYLESKAANRFWQWIGQSRVTESAFAESHPVQFYHWFDHSLLPTHRPRSTDFDANEKASYELFYNFAEHAFEFQSQIKHILLGTDFDWNYLQEQARYYLYHRLNLGDEKTQSIWDRIDRAFQLPNVHGMSVYPMTRMEYDSLNWETQRFDAVLESFSSRSQTASLVEHRQVQTILKVQQAFHSSKGFQSIANPQPQNELSQYRVHSVEALPASRDSIKEQPLALNGASA